MKKVAVIHTFLYSVDDLKELFRRYVPEVEMINIIDDSLLQEALKNKGVTPDIHMRMSSYMHIAQDLGADMILNQCSSVSEVSEYVSQQLKIPVAKIDGPMAEEAVKLGNCISVIATAISTVEPSSRLIENTAKKLNKKIIVNRVFVDGAYDALLKQGNREKHNRMIIDAIKSVEAKSDVIVLAQGSMYKLVPLLSDIHIPVLTSFESGVKQIREILHLD